MVNYTLTPQEGFFILRLFWGRMLIEEHQIEGTEKEIEEQKNRLISRLFDWEKEILI